MSLPLLIITDGTTTVDLLSRTGYHLSDWRPMIAPFKNDGIRRSSVISEGSRLVGYQYDNVIETFTLDMDERSQDGAARQLQVLARLLMQAVNYWTKSDVNDPVWIEARSGDEQYTRYATVMNYKMESIGNPYGAEFIGRGVNKIGMSELVLTIERSHWMSNPPCIGSPLAISSTYTQWETSIPYGRTSYAAPTRTAQEVFVGNRFTDNNITHIFTCTAGGVFSANKIGSAFPQTLLPVAPATGDMVYFGICDQVSTQGGPFADLIFDIATAAIYAGGSTGAWQYWRPSGGGAWVPCVFVHDRSAVAANQPLSLTGVHSVHWDQWDNVGGALWGPCAVNGVTGWWVRMILTIGGGASVTVPTQQNRQVYTANVAYVDVDSTQIKGDVDALLHFSQCAVSEELMAFISMQRDADIILMGLRSLDRELPYLNIFNAYNNLSDRQQPPFASCDLVDVARCSFIDSCESPTGRCVQYISAGIVADTDAVCFRIATPDYVRSYYGRYHAFLRMRLVAGTATNLLFTLKLYTAGGTVPLPIISLIWSGDAVPGIASTFATLDMGTISIPGFAVDARYAGAAVPDLRITVSVRSLAATTARLYDIVLIPCDEWTCEVSSPNRPTMTGKLTSYDGLFIDTDSISLPTELVLSSIDLESGGSLGSVSGMRVITNGRAIAHPKRTMRYWFMSSSSYTLATYQRRSYPDTVLSTSIESTQRYLSLRGSE